MRPTLLLGLGFLLLLSFSTTGRAELRLAGLFVDGAVLQRDRAVPVWGWTDPDTAVKISFRDHNASVTAGADGRWKATLPAMPAESTGAVLTVTAGAQTVRVHDVVVGEVWLCSGQSNMEWTVVQSADSEREIREAAFPLIRQFRVPKTPAESPLPDVRGQWLPATPRHVGGFTGVGYFFARDIHRSLEGVPVGLINASWGGKMIEVFTAPSAVARTPHGDALKRRWELEVEEMARRQETHGVVVAEWEKARDAAKRLGQTFTRSLPMSPAVILAQHRPGCVFNGMIAPLVPYALRGFLWYQGEHNISRPQEYRSLFGAMIADWREHFGQGELSFYFVQLSSFRAPMDKSRLGFAELREAQARTLEVAGTGMAVTIDIGTPDNVHPRNKQDVGARLARLAKAKTYGIPVEWSGPRLSSVQRTDAGIRLTFDHAAGGLVARRTPLPGFEAAGADGIFRPIAATAHAKSVRLVPDGRSDLKVVRYAWANAPETALFNSEGLPAAPFLTSLP